MATQSVDLATICVNMTPQGLARLRLGAGLGNPAEAGQVFSVDVATWYRWEAGKQELSKPGLLWWALRAWKHRKVLDRIDAGLPCECQAINPDPSADKYIAQYECRHCLERFDGAKNINKAYLKADPIIHHNCTPDIIGVADLQCFVKQ